MGKKCALCGLESPIMDIFDYHHLDESTKSFAISSAFGSKGWTAIQRELFKCVMLCAVCHRKIHFWKRVEPEKHKAVTHTLYKNRRYWSEAKLQFLKESYQNCKSPTDLLKHFPGITVEALRMKANALGLRHCSATSRWTAEEKEILYSNRDLPYKEMEILLPGRTADAIASKSKRLNLQRTDQFRRK